MKHGLKLFASITVLTLLSACATSVMTPEQALEKHKAVFNPDNMDENFESLYKLYPSKKITRTAPIYTLNEAFSDDALPYTYVYGDETKNLEQFLKDVQTTGMIVMHGDDVVFETYDRGHSRESLNMQMSVTKSILSTLIGIAIDEGDIANVTDQIVTYTPELKGTAYDGVTIKQALEMTSGVKFDEGFGRYDSDLVQAKIAAQTDSLNAYVKGLERELEPGSYNRYSSVDAHALGLMLEGATGQPFERYFKAKLWDKIGAEGDAYMLQDIQGTPVFFGGLNLRLRDMLRFGKLLLDDGVNYKGEQIVPKNWKKEATIPDAPHLMPMADNPLSDSGFGYKYQWWIPFTPDGNDFAAIGVYGQFIYVNPSRNVVIAKTSAYKNYTQDGGYMNHETLIAFQTIAKHLSSQ